METKNRRDFDQELGGLKDSKVVGIVSCPWTGQRVVPRTSMGRQET